MIYIYILCVCFLLDKAQNFVPNGSFENYTVCPRSASFFDINYWCGLSGGEEGFNVCNNSTGNLLGVPYNQFDGFQYARTGNGFGAVLIHIPGSGQQDKREYLHVRLVNTLQSGKTYCGTFYVNLSNEFRYTSDRIGMALTSGSFSCNQAMPMPQTIAPLNLIPQVDNPQGTFMADTLNWTEVSGTFTANGTESYLTLGNFYNDANTTVILTNLPAQRTIIYFFIDDVSLEEVFPAKAKNDTLMMQGDSVVVGNNSSEAAIYSWQPSAGLSCTNCPNPKASPTITTTYTLTKTQCKATTTDVITVTVSPTGIAEAEALEAVVKISPNPVSDFLNIDISKLSDKYQLQSKITDVLGREILETEFKEQIDVSFLQKGVYFVSLEQGGKTLVTKKFIKE